MSENDTVQTVATREWVEKLERTYETWSKLGTCRVRIFGGAQLLAEWKRYNEQTGGLEK
jgi:hypothetical protein